MKSNAKLISQIEGMRNKWNGSWFNSNYLAKKIESMAQEVEDLYEMFSTSIADTENQCYQLYKFKIEQKQLAIKNDLKISHLKVKTKLLQETLENK